MDSATKEYIEPRLTDGMVVYPLDETMTELTAPIMALDSLRRLALDNAFFIPHLFEYLAFLVDPLLTAFPSFTILANTAS
ncbi:MAG: hypothetical protein LKK13_02470 [Bacilli bacterium]|nr:hypothetical protein [Bacilli bacterium]